MKFKTLKRSALLIVTFLILCGLFISIEGAILPETVCAFGYDEVNRAEISPFITLDCEDNDFNNSSASAMLFGVMPIKQIDVKILENKKLIVGGMPFGVKLYTDGLMIVGISEVDSENGNINPGYAAGLRCGDMIKNINGKKAQSLAQLANASAESNGNNVKFHIKRGDSEFDTDITPVKSKSDNSYKFGLWIRDSTAGIGTVTYIDPATSSFAGLGHGICDVDTGLLLPMREGILSDVTINGYEKGIAGNPGELKGLFGTRNIGKLIENTEYGVYGIIDKSNISGEEFEVGLKDSVEEGDAYILCTLDSNSIEKYDIKIEKINSFSKEVKNFVVKITDPVLIEKTGGIVQGMSGSPIIQNGKLIGAVTHVLVDDPTRGYGIFIENMLSNSPL